MPFRRLIAKDKATGAPVEVEWEDTGPAQTGGWLTIFKIPGGITVHSLFNPENGKHDSVERSAFDRFMLEDSGIDMSNAIFPWEEQTASVEK